MLPGLSPLHACEGGIANRGLIQVLLELLFRSELLYERLSTFPCEALIDHWHRSAEPFSRSKKVRLPYSLATSSLILVTVSFFFPPRVMWRSFWCAMIGAHSLLWRMRAKEELTALAQPR